MKTLSFHESLAMNPDAGGVRYCIRNKNELTDNNEKICSYFSDRVSRDIDFTANGLLRDRPSALELKAKLKLFLKLTDRM